MHTKALKKMISQFEELFGKEGIKYDIQGEVTHTLHAHRLVEFTKQNYGEEVAAKVVDELFKTYHSSGGNLASLDVLVDAAVTSGMDKQRVSKFLKSKELVNEILDQVVKQQTSFESLGGVPHFRVTVNNSNSFEFPGKKRRFY